MAERPVSDYTEEDLRLSDALLLSWEIVSPKMSQRLAAFRSEARRERDKAHDGTVRKWLKDREDGSSEEVTRYRFPAWQLIDLIRGAVQSEREACERIVQRMIGSSDWSKTGYDTCIEILRLMRERAT